ncbi:MAG: cytochrome c [Anaerolineae bacterium]|nr:cytochrome c [Anaerolineae bacterium]
MKASVIRFAQMFALVAIALIVLLLTTGFFGERPAHALPEYADRTGEPCSTCHVSPGGGGPRTLRGLLWTAQGRPDLVPSLGNILIAPGVTDGVELYDLACSACHGISGQGLFGTTLVNSGLSENNVRSAILRGRERSGMPPFDGLLSNEQMDALVAYVVGIASGEFEPAPLSYPLPEAQFECSDPHSPDGESCGGN